MGAITIRKLDDDVSIDPRLRYRPDVFSVHRHGEDRRLWWSRSLV